VSQRFFVKLVVVGQFASTYLTDTAQKTTFAKRRGRPDRFGLKRMTADYADLADSIRQIRVIRGKFFPGFCFTPREGRRRR
jgi:hypothetical protein